MNAEEHAGHTLRRAGLTFIDFTYPILVATVFFGIYITILLAVTYSLIAKKLGRWPKAFLYILIYILFALTAALYSLQVAQVLGLDPYVLRSPTVWKDAEGTIRGYYAFVGRLSRVTNILFQCQMIVGNALLIYRAWTIWFDRKVLMLIPGAVWGIQILNMVIQVGLCHSTGTSGTSVCKATRTFAQVLTILTNALITGLVFRRAWMERDAFYAVIGFNKVKAFGAFFALIFESGAVYVLVMTARLCVTMISLHRSQSRKPMVAILSIYTTVQFVGMYPCFVFIIRRYSIWNCWTHNGTRASSHYASSNSSRENSNGPMRTHNLTLPSFRSHPSSSESGPSRPSASSGTGTSLDSYSTNKAVVGARVRHDHRDF